MTNSAFELIKPFLKKSVKVAFKEYEAGQQVFLTGKEGDYIRLTIVEDDEDGAPAFFLIEPGDEPPAPVPAPAKPEPPLLKNLAYCPGSHKQHSLSPDLKVSDISKALPGVQLREGDDGKVRYEWSFEYKGQQCNIWDYHGAKWSAYGPWWCFEELGLDKGKLRK